MKQRKHTRTNIFGLTLVTALASLGYAQVGSSIWNSADSKVIRKGEIQVENNLINVDNQIVEIEGVCKLKSEGATCWKPDGSPNTSLTEALTKSILQMDNSNSRTFPVSYKRKHRFLVLKDTRLPRSSNSGRYGEFFNWNNSSRESVEGWTSSTNAIGSASSNGFDGSYTRQNVFEGVFESETKDFPFRFAFRAANGRAITIPVKQGVFDVEGNKFELTSIGDIKEAKASNTRNLGYGYYFQPLTEMVFKTVAADNPYSYFTLTPADAKGNPIAFVTKKGVPVATEVAQKWMTEHINLPSDERERKSPYVQAGMAYVDPPAYNLVNGSVLPVRFNVAKEYVKNFIVSIGKREVYVFDKVRLDPK